MAISRHEYGGIKENLSRVTKLTLAVGAFTIASMTGEAVAQQGHPNQHRRISADKIVKEHLLHHKSEKLDLNHEFVWTTRQYEPTATGPKASFSEVTHIVTSPIVAEDKGKQRDFGLMQQGDSLDSLRVIEVPANAQVENTEYSYYHCGAEPTTKNGVIRLGLYGEPVTNISDTHGGHEVARVGQDETFAAGQPIIDGPPLPPGFCAK
jgi:hypothetical protein